jgi:hypothetical protein
MADDDADLELDEAPAAEVEDAEPERGASVREHLERAVKKHSAESEETTEKPKREDRGAKGRDSSTGKFTKDKTAAPERPLASGAKLPDSPTETKAAPVTPTATDAAPKSWTKEAQGQWASLPQQIRAEITKRETDMANGARQLQQRYGSIHETVQKAAPMFQKYGRSPDEGIAQIVAWFEAIERAPQAAIAELAKSYGVNLSTGPAPTAQPGVPPNQNPTQAQQLDPRYATREQAQQWEQFLQRQQASATVAAVNAWGANKPHYQNETVRLKMRSIVAGAAQTKDSSYLKPDGSEIDLDKVYEEAIWAIPEVRETILKEQAEARKAERQAAAEKARRAASSMRPGAPGNAGPAGYNSGLKKGSPIREHIKAALEEHRS